MIAMKLAWKIIIWFAAFLLAALGITVLMAIPGMYSDNYPAASLGYPTGYVSNQGFPLEQFWENFFNQAKICIMLGIVIGGFVLGFSALCKHFLGKAQ